MSSILNVIANLFQQVYNLMSKVPTGLGLNLLQFCLAILIIGALFSLLIAGANQSVHENYMDIRSERKHDRLKPKRQREGDANYIRRKMMR